MNASVVEEMVSPKLSVMFFILMLNSLLNLNMDLQYDYDKLLYLIAEKESKFQCQIMDPYNTTYGRYQVTPYLVQKYGYKIPMTCEEQDEMMLKLAKMYEQLLNIKKYEFKYHNGILLHRTNLLVAMHYAPHGTIRYLETGVDFGNGLFTVSDLLRKYESSTFYKLK